MIPYIYHLRREGGKQVVYVCMCVVGIETNAGFSSVF